MKHYETIRAYYSQNWRVFRIIQSSEISRTAYELSKIRNDISHYGYNLYDDKRPSKSYEELKAIIESSYNDFRRYIKREDAKKKSELLKVY